MVALLDDEPLLLPPQAASTQTLAKNSTPLAQTRNDGMGDDPVIFDIAATIPNAATPDYHRKYLADSTDRGD